MTRRGRGRRELGLVGLVTLGLATGCGAESVAPARRVATEPVPAVPPEPPVETITAADLREHVEYLASDDLAGRGTLTLGAAKAASYLENEFRAYGLAPLPGRTSLRVPYALEVPGFDPAGTGAVVTVGATTTALVAGTDLAPLRSGRGAAAELGAAGGEVVFAGYGLPGDYAGLEVAGTIVLVLSHSPLELPDDAKVSAPLRAVLEWAGSMLADGVGDKLQAAKRRGARGLLYVANPLRHGPHDDLSLDLSPRLPLTAAEQAKAEQAKAEQAKAKAKADAKPEATPPFIALRLSQPAAELLFAGSGTTLRDAQLALDGGARARTIRLAAARAELTVAERPVRPASADDVIGYLEGRDPTLRDQWIVIGGHYDHLGTKVGDGDQIFNGADDNASGTAGVLEVAEAFAALPPLERPRRSVVFMAFSGEELGLLGSRALFLENSIDPGRIVFMLNLDMIGRNPGEAIEVSGDAFATGVRELVDEENLAFGLPLAWSGPAYAANSDHDAFHVEGIPDVFFFTGFHDDYHGAADHADKLAYDRMQAIARLSFRIVERLGTGELTPVALRELAWLGATLELPHGGPARLAAIEARSRGEAAGLAAGDVVTGVAGQPTTGIALLRALEALEADASLTVELSRDGAARTLALTRPRRGRLGIDDVEPPSERTRKRLGLAEHQGYRVVSLQARSAAAMAGLRAGDILLAVGGRPVGGQGSLTAASARVFAGDRVVLAVLRDGTALDLAVVAPAAPRHP